MGAASKVVDTVVGVVEDVGNAIDNTVQSAIDDPIGTAAMITTAIVAPQLLPVVSAANTVAKGGSLEQAALNAGASYLGGQVGAEVGAETGSNIAGGASAGATTAGLRGGDITQGAISGGLSGAIKSGAQEISDQNLEDWSRAQAEKSYENAPSPTEQDVLMSDSGASSSSPLSTLDDTSAPEGYDPLMTTKQMETAGNFAKNAILNAQNASGRTAGLSGAGTTGAGDAINNFDLKVPWLQSGTSILENKPLKEDEKMADALSGDEELNQIYAGITPELKDAFASRGIGSGILSGATPQISGLGEDTMSFASGGSSSCCSGSSLGSLAGNMAQYMPKFATPYTGGMMPTTASNKRQPFTMAALKQLQSHISNYGNIGGMAQGGLPAKYEEAKPEGHHPEFVTGLTGYYACGGGTGQSDDIPAMLHDGDYVMDADVVAALGDGSSKAGKQVLDGFLKQVPHRDTASGKPVPAKIADGEYVFPEGFVTALGGGDNKAGSKILDGMREKLRAHKRSAPTSKIPPKAKSPLDYIKGMKG